MQENNTEKRTIRRMKRTFHGQNQETQKKKIKNKRRPPRPVTYVNVCDVLLDFFLLLKHPCQYPVIDILAQRGCRGRRD